MRPHAAELADLFGPAARVVDLVVAGRRASVVYDVVDREAQRRAAVGLGAIQGRRLVEALAMLPLGAAVPWDDIEPLTQVALDNAPAGCVLSLSETVERVIEPAVEPRCFLTVYEGRRSVEDVSLFAAMAPRLVVGRQRPTPATIDQVRELGVGYATAGGEGVQIVVQPTTRHIRPGPRRWFVQERIWQLHQESAEIHAFR